jgi:hypothetical protein
MVNRADPNSAGFDEVTHQIPPSKSRRATGNSNGSRPRAGPAADLSSPPWRENIAPKSQLDANDRRDGRATDSTERLALQIALEKHRNWLKWQQMLRNLISYGGIIALTAAFAFLLEVAHFPAQVAARIAIYGLVTALGGYGLNSLISKIPPWKSSRDEKQSRDEDKSLFWDLTATPTAIRSR